MRSIAVATVLMATLAGCATNYAAKPADQVAQAITIKDSEFDSHRTWVGPQAFSETQRGLFVDNETLRMLVLKDKKTGAVKHVLNVQIMYSGSWRFYETMSLRGGAQQRLNVVARDVGACSGMGCIYTESVSVDMTPEMLSQAQRGMEIRLNARSGHENVVTIPSSYVSGVLSAASQSKI